MQEESVIDHIVIRRTDKWISSNHKDNITLYWDIRLF